LANLGQLRSRVASKIGMDTSDSAEVTLLDSWFNEGYEDVLVRSRCKVNCADMTLTANEWRYTLSTTPLAVLEVWTESSAGLTVPFERTTSEHILKLRAGLATNNGAPVRYYATEGADLFLVWPTPTSAETVKLLYVPRPTAMSATSDSPSYIPSEHHKALEFYALWQAADYDDDGSSQVGEVYRVQYEGVDGRGGILRRIRQGNRWKGGRSLGPARVGRRWPIRPHDPSTDSYW